MRVSNRFDFVSFYTDGERSLDGIHGNDQRAVPIALDEYSFETIQCSAPDSHPLTDLEERMGRPGQ